MKQRRIVSVARLGDLLHFGHLLLTFGDFLLVTLPIIRGKKKSHKNYFSLLCVLSLPAHGSDASSPDTKAHEVFAVQSAI